MLQLSPIFSLALTPGWIMDLVHHLTMPRVLVRPAISIDLSPLQSCCNMLSMAEGQSIFLNTNELSHLRLHVLSCRKATLPCICSFLQYSVFTKSGQPRSGHSLGLQQALDEV